MGANGILNVNKPAGYTSFRVVEIIRRISGQKHVGHAGTLDPIAIGVLPVCLGQATRIVEFLHTYPKEYIAEIVLGATTDTYDGSGTITCQRDASHVTEELILKTLQSFKGTIDQVPPAYSALKVKGRQSYELARAGIKIEHQPRKVRIDLIELIEYKHPRFQLKILCSTGTYIRSLAYDLGNVLGCGAYLANLARTAYGPFSITDSKSLEELGTACAANRLSDLLYPVDYPLQTLEKHVVSDDIAVRIVQGHDISLPGLSQCQGSNLRVYNSSGNFFAILKLSPDSGLWHPEKVFNL